MQIKRIDVLPLKLGLIPDLAANLYRSAHQGFADLFRRCQVEPVLDRT